MFSHISIYPNRSKYLFLLAVVDACCFAAASSSAAASFLATDLVLGVLGTISMGAATVVAGVLGLAACISSSSAVFFFLLAGSSSSVTTFLGLPTFLFLGL
jgi:hypothetical protein